MLVLMYLNVLTNDDFIRTSYSLRNPTLSHRKLETQTLQILVMQTGKCYLAQYQGWIFLFYRTVWITQMPVREMKLSKPHTGWCAIKQGQGWVSGPGMDNLKANNLWKPAVAIELLYTVCIHLGVAWIELVQKERTDITGILSIFDFL